MRKRATPLPAPCQSWCYTVGTILAMTRNERDGDSLTAPRLVSLSCQRRCVGELTATEERGFRSTAPSWGERAR